MDQFTYPKAGINFVTEIYRALVEKHQSGVKVCLTVTLGINKECEMKKSTRLNFEVLCIRAKMLQSI